MQGATEKGTYKVLTLLDAVTASGSSEPVVIAGAKKVTLLLTRADHVAGTSTFDVDVSLDGVTYVGFDKLVTNAANTNAQTKVRVASVALAADGTSIVSLDLEHDAFFTMKVNVVEVTDGTHSAKALIEF